jgi:hypothetical protein
MITNHKILFLIGNLTMKLKVIMAVLCSLLLFAIHSDAENITQEKPVAFLPEQIFEFEPVVEGAVVIHDFIIQNKGTAPLVIHKATAG